MFNTSNLSTDEKLTRTKIQMYKRSPFFSYILLHMKLKEDVDNRLPVPSMGVDPSGTLWWRKEFIDKLSEEELLGVICHETLHIALQHLERAKGRETMIFNIANDLVINDLLLQNEFTLPQKGLIPDKYTHSFKIKGHEIKDLNKRSSEDVYDEIYPLIPKTYIHALGNMGNGKNDDSKQQGRGKDGKSPGKLSGKDKEQIENLKGFDNHIYGKQNKEKDNEQDRIQSDRQQKWKQIIAEAAQLAKQQGQLPAGLERTIDDLLDSKINWKSKLYKYVVSQIMFDYSWCLEKGTLISTKNGFKEIQKLKKGDNIFGEKNKEIVQNKVKNITSSEVKKKYIIYTKTGRRLVCSGNHKILTEHGYVQAKDLNIGVKVITE